MDSGAGSALLFPPRGSRPARSRCLKVRACPWRSILDGHFTRASRLFFFFVHACMGLALHSPYLGEACVIRPRAASITLAQFLPLLQAESAGLQYIRTAKMRVLTSAGIIQRVDFCEFVPPLSTSAPTGGQSWYLIMVVPL